MKHSRPRHATLIVLATVLLGAIVPAAASAESTNRWENPCGDQIYQSPHICTVILNGAMRFAKAPGEFAESQLVRDSSSATKGKVDSVSASSAAYVNLAGVWSLFTSSSGFDNVVNLLGTVKMSIANSVLSPYPVSVIANGERISAKPNEAAGITDTTKLGLTCDNDGYLACETPGVWVNNRKWNLLGDHVVPQRITGFATIETRPLIVKMINMTDQPLVPSSDVRVDNMKRSGTIATPAQITGISDTGRPGVGYYHLYRDASRGGSVSLSYRFADGAAGERTLSGGALFATVRVDGDGTTETSSCQPPTGLAVSVECSVTLLGSANGTLQAVVVVQT